MPNPFSQFITSRFIDPAVERRLAAAGVQKDTQAFAVGVLQQPILPLRDTLGQYPDADYDLLYAIYQKHVGLLLRRPVGGERDRQRLAHRPAGRGRRTDGQAAPGDDGLGALAEESQPDQTLLPHAL